MSDKTIYLHKSEHTDTKWAYYCGILNLPIETETIKLTVRKARAI